MSNWVSCLQDLIAGRQRFVIVSIASIRGSSPREVGAKMIVTETETYGTIGGGQLEYQCTALACEWFRASGNGSAATFLRRFPLGASFGQCCGGVVEVLFEQTEPAMAHWLTPLIEAFDTDTPCAVVTVGDTHAGLQKLVVTERRIFPPNANADEKIIARARRLLRENARAYSVTVTVDSNIKVRALFEPVQRADFSVAVFGAGHVGRAVIATLATLDWRIDWYDSRTDLFPDRLPANVSTHDLQQSADAIATVPCGSFVLVMTHSHALDFEICARLLERNDFRYCGLIGSQSKRRRFEKRFRALGLTDECIARLTCPIGVGVTGKRPAEIAIAVATQLLQLGEQIKQRDPVTVAGTREA